MTKHIGSQKSLLDTKTVSWIPFWVVAHLGKSVQLSKPYRDSIGKPYPQGATAKLVSIQAGEVKPYVTVVLDDDPTRSEENFDFGSLRPA